MAVEELHEITLVTHKSQRRDVIDFLHSEGFMHITPAEETSNPFKLEKDAPMSVVTKISEQFLEVRWMSEHLPSKKEYIFSNRDLKEIIKDTKELKKAIHKQLAVAIDAINAAQTEIEELKQRKITLSKIPFSLDKAFSGKHIGSQVLIYLVQTNENLVGAFDELKVTVFNQGEYNIVLGLREEKEQIDEIISKKSGYIADFHLKNPIKEELKLIDKKIKELHKIHKQAKQTISKLANKHNDKIGQLKHDLTIYHDRYEVTQSLLQTKETTIFQGFVAKRDLARLHTITNKIPVHITSQKATKGPSKLKNLPYVRSFEFITKMFGLPQYAKVDPTLYLAFFIPLFFGIMFSDVGYGIMVTIVAALLLKYATATKPIMKDSGVVLLTCGITTIFFGAIFGSFFGDLIPIGTALMNPFADAQLLLIIALGLGLIHLNLAQLTSIFENLRAGQFKTFLLDNVSVVSLEIGVALLALGNKAGWIGLGLGIVLFIAKSSLMGLMEISGLVGTWFSYARILALALATGGIALGINIMAKQLFELGVIGIILGALLLVFGHAFNFVLNILGSCIHAVRLHFIEFFSQCYEGGGKKFKSFDTKRVKDSI